MKNEKKNGGKPPFQVHHRSPEFLMKLINNNAVKGPQENYQSQNAGEDFIDGNLRTALQYFKMSIPGLREWIMAGHWLTYK